MAISHIRTRQSLDIVGLAVTFLLAFLSRSVLIPITIVWMACVISPSSAASPSIPLVSVHHCWDHHWYVWLPRHPMYEAVEIMSIDTPGNPYKAVWVFFTERDGNKRQLYFVNDRRIAEGLDGGHYRDIAYQRTGKAGLGQSVHVAFTGLEDTKIEIAIGVDDTPLTRMGAGLTDQSGHSADQLFLLFHRDRNAWATSNTVLIDGRDFSFRAGDDPEGKHSFVAAYSAGIQIALFPFGRWSFREDGPRLSDTSSGLSFTAEDQGTRLVADFPGYYNRLTLGLDANGALESYRHDTASHRLVMTLDRALPLVSWAPRAVRAFSIYLDPPDPVARGQVVSEPTAAGRRLSWTFLSPAWAIDYPFESIIETGRGEVALTTRSLRSQ